MLIWNIPKTIVQGDRLSWREHLPDYDPADTLSCFIRGQSGAIDLTASGTSDGFEFTLLEIQSQALSVGLSQAQFALFPSGGGRQTLGVVDLQVLPSFDNLSTVDPRSSEEIELEQITAAIAKLASGAVSEYEIGDRRVRYQDLDSLTRRQEYLRQRIAIAQGKANAGGRNVGTKFCN